MKLFADPEKEARIFLSQGGHPPDCRAESRFAGMLTPEEEEGVREIISEYVNTRIKAGEHGIST